MAKRKPGRPPFKITKEVLRKAEGFASRGMTQMQIADALGINYDTLMKYKNLNTDFLEAIKAGQAKGIAEITNALFNQGKNGNTSAAIFYLKNRAGWADKQEVDMRTNVSFENETLREIQEEIKNGK